MLRILALALVSAASLYCQRRFSWQNACFNNPGAPYCQGHDFAIKPPAPAKNAGSKSIVTNPSPSIPNHVTPSVIVVGGIDWRFADPLADALVGFNFGGVSASPLARGLITRLGVSQGLTEADMEKVFDKLSGVDHVAISIRDSRIVIMVTRATDSTLPALDSGWKAVPLAGTAMLIGHADAVDEAVQRIAMEGPPAELTRLFQDRQANSEFWAVGSGSFVGPQAVDAGLKRFSLTLSTRSRLASDAAFEFEGAPSTDTLRIWPVLGTAAIEGNVVNIRASIEANDVHKSFAEMAGSPLGQRLAAVVASVRNLPVRDTNLPKQTKPVIYGLDGGPKVVNQYQER